MPARKLPASANLDNLKKQAKSLLNAIRDKDPATLSRIKPYFSDPVAMGLQDAQLVLARDYGFSSWKALKRQLESSLPSNHLSEDQLVNEFLALVVLVYSETESADPRRFEQAAKILEEHPDMLAKSFHAAVAAGDVTRVSAILKSDSTWSNRKGGFHHWEPLMYATYSRLPGISTFEVGKLLIEHGADPNAYYLWGGQYRFTALTGVFGQGEGGPVNLPEHPEFKRFARMLLESGANPNDSQAAYNRIFSDDNICLELLLEFGLGSEDKNNWLLEENGSLIPHTQSTMQYQLSYAVNHGKLDRVKLLVEHGADINQLDADGKTHYENALLERRNEVADYLLSQGATKVALNEIDVFRNAIMDADESTTQTMLSNAPALKDQLLSAKPHLIEKAVDLDRPDAIRILLNLGFDINHMSGRTALHQAAWLGNIKLIKMLISAGADATLRDHIVFVPPIGWALHNNKPEAVELLDALPMDIFTAAIRGNNDCLGSILDKDNSLLDMKFADIRPCPDKPCNMDWMTPLAFAVNGNQHSSARLLLDRGANCRVDNGAGLRLIDLARDNADQNMVGLLESYF